MSIFITNIKRILRKKYNIFFTIILPAVLIVLSMNGSFEKSSSIVIGVVDNDNTKYTTGMVNFLEKDVDILRLGDDEIEPSIIDNRVDYIIKIDRGFTEKIICCKNTDIKGYEIERSDLGFVVKNYLNEYINISNNIAAISNRDEKRFYDGMNAYNNGLISAEYKGIGINVDKKSTTYSSLGFILISILSLATSIPNILMQDKETKVYYRIFSTPIPNKKYMIMNILSFLGILSLQIILILFLMKIICHADFGSSNINMFAVLFVFSIVSISIGTCIAGFCKNFSQFWTTTTLINTPLLMLGGCYWPWERMPETMQKISYFLPTTWGLKAAQKVLYSTSLLDAKTEIGILLLFALVFFLLSSWKKRDISA